VIARFVKQRAARVDAAEKMAGDRYRYGLLLATLGAVLVSVAVFLPWYGVTLTTKGVASIQRVGRPLATPQANAQLRRDLRALHSSPASPARGQTSAVSAQQVLSNIGVALLVLAGLALLDALFGLFRVSGVPEGSGASLLVLGTVATACVLYRLLEPPTPAGGLLALSLREGVWLALVGALMMLAGGLWRGVPAATFGEERLERAWPGLSGWTAQR
jgi:hypothetical protein